jgi:uncharacterized protein YdeI (BOF family)
MLRAAVIVFALSVCGVGCSPKGKILGREPSGSTTTVLAIRAGDAPSPLMLKGVLVEKCPVAGCWFRIQDETGEIKVDTKSAGFVVMDLPLKTVVTVGGKVVMAGEEPQIEATGLRY